MFGLVIEKTSFGIYPNPPYLKLNSGTPSNKKTGPETEPSAMLCVLSSQRNKSGNKEHNAENLSPWRFGVESDDYENNHSVENDLERFGILSNPIEASESSHFRSPFIFLCLLKI